MIQTANKAQVCPGEEVIYSMVVYNSGSMDKNIAIREEYDKSELHFKEIVYDNQYGPGQRYQCFYETAPYQKFIEKEFDLPRVELLDSSYRFTFNETYPSYTHYTSTVPGCDIMYDTTRPEYQMYTSNLELVADAYADQLLIEYTNLKNTGASESVALSQALVLADDYIAANILTIAPTYDATFITAHIAECYEAQYYDRNFFDL